MRRDAQLIDLSREHYSALKLAKQLRQADAGTVQLKMSLLEQAMPALERHFQEEESTLLQQLAQFGETALIERLLDEHRQLRQLQQHASDQESLAQFGQLLEQHVRFEERSVFATLQQHWALQGGQPRKPRARSRRC
ncbi:hemerythrin domain-containing protein [Chitinibacter bivalviorum]|uniref:Hemerythrin domain-containing protein n=1 Tax=Chitinibacter bivalviorum TaxID=2739434 RepID=A0A7H9BFZ2_9NEIS|nr:hemerythrin domain-containing protein [Chitinibacter bivalviorum]QLG87118.1 hemerythrin domain-containing protein [Chitinibacter bivalviorum]